MLTYVTVRNEVPYLRLYFQSRSSEIRERKCKRDVVDLISIGQQGRTFTTKAEEDLTMEDELRGIQQGFTIESVHGISGNNYELSDPYNNAQYTHRSIDLSMILIVSNAFLTMLLLPCRMRL